MRSKSLIQSKKVANCHMFQRCESKSAHDGPLKVVYAAAIYAFTNAHLCSMNAAFLLVGETFATTASWTDADDCAS